MLRRPVPGPFARVRRVIGRRRLRTGRGLRSRSVLVVGIGLVAAAAFVVTLLHWVGGGGGSDPVVPNAGPALDLPSAPGLEPATPAPAGSPTSPASSPTASSTVGGVLQQQIDRAFPEDSRIDRVGLPRHEVTITVTADGTIAALAYKIRDASPAQYSGTYLSSPFTVTTVGRSDGLIAAVLAQAASNATSITCTITVDGSTRTHHVTQGAHHFVYCLG